MLSQEGVRRIFELRKQGLNISQIARALKISRPTVLKYLKTEESEPTNINPPLLNTPYKSLTKEQEREEGRVRYGEEQLRKQRYLTEREEWIKSKAEGAVNHLKYITPYQFQNLLNVKHFLTLKEEVRKTLIPLYGKESDWTIKDLIKQITKDYHDEHIKPSADKILQEKELKQREEDRERNRQSLINRGVGSVYWKTLNDDIDFSERRELEDFVKEGLKEELLGEETEGELERLVETLINEWFEEG